MSGVRFRFDRIQGMVVNSNVLLNIHVANFSVGAIAQYVAKIEHVLAELALNEVPPKQLMYENLRKDFKDCPYFQYEFRKIRNSPLGSKYRTWDWLFEKIKKWWVDYSGDRNFHQFEQ